MLGRRLVAVGSLLLVSLAPTLATLAPPMSTIRRATMESDVIVEGTILSVAEATSVEQEHTAILGVGRVVWSDAPIGGTLELRWASNRKSQPDGTVLMALPGPAQLDEFIGKKALWMLVARSGLRCWSYPLELDDLPFEELHYLSMAVQDPDYVDPARPGLPKMKLVAELEADPKAAEKRAAVIEYLNGAYEARRK